MWNNITSRIFGSSSQPALAGRVAEPVRIQARVVENTGSPAKQPWRTVGLTEQRLRAANKQSWVTSTKGWSDLLNRFSGR
jgi:hypothetical protein